MRHRHHSRAFDQVRRNSPHFSTEALLWLRSGNQLASRETIVCERYPPEKKPSRSVGGQQHRFCRASTLYRAQGEHSCTTSEDPCRAWLAEVVEGQTNISQGTCSHMTATQQHKLPLRTTVTPPACLCYEHLSSARAEWPSGIDVHRDVALIVASLALRTCGCFVARLRQLRGAGGREELGGLLVALEERGGLLVCGGGRTLQAAGQGHRPKSRSMDRSIADTGCVLHFICWCHAAAKRGES
mmetsp:Transcript_89461/g.186909  ORF Transcript_89461/g.186909 Transcript_89461/m.186909 type:complete len:242 (+) Transcript_89461:1051-1776(+)